MYSLVLNSAVLTGVVRLMGSTDWRTFQAALYSKSRTVWERRAQVTSPFVSKQPSVLLVKELDNTAALCLFTSTVACLLLLPGLFSHESSVSAL